MRLVSKFLFRPPRSQSREFGGAAYAMVPFWPPAARAAFAEAIVAPTLEERSVLLEKVRADAARLFEEELAERYRVFDVRAVIPRVRWNNTAVSVRRPRRWVCSVTLSAVRAARDSDHSRV